MDKIALLKKTQVTWLNSIGLNSGLKISLNYLGLRYKETRRKVYYFGKRNNLYVYICLMQLLFTATLWGFQQHPTLQCHYFSDLLLHSSHYHYKCRLPIHTLYPCYSRSGYGKLPLNHSLIIVHIFEMQNKICAPGISEKIVNKSTQNLLFSAHNSWRACSRRNFAIQKIATWTIFSECKPPFPHLPLPPPW